MKVTNMKLVFLPAHTTCMLQTPMLQHQLLQTGCTKAKFANTTTLLRRPFDDGPIGGQVRGAPLHLFDFRRLFLVRVWLELGQDFNSWI